jgi:hypothetical protein
MQNDIAAVGWRGDGMILAIDPGPRESGVVLFDAGRVLQHHIVSSENLRNMLRHGFTFRETLVIEAMLESRGMPMMRDHVTTVRYAAFFQEAWESHGGRVVLLDRAAIKAAVCGHARATDSNVRAALLDRLGPQGTKKAPGPTHGVKSHAWAALAAAVAFLDGCKVAYDSAKKEAAA